MKKEKSCGAVILKNDGGKTKVLLVQMKNGGHFAFPKGHVEGNETEHETALREIFEETSLSVGFIDGFRESTEYSPKEGVIKEVVYFLAVPKIEDIKRQEEEIMSILWEDADKAIDKVTFENDREILKKAVRFKKVTDFAVANGYEAVEKSKPWNGYECYEPIMFEDEIAFIGPPLVILVKGDEIRMSTPEEAFARIDEC